MTIKRSVRVLSEPDEIEKASHFLDDGDQEKWENGELGRDPKHAHVMKSPGLSDSITSLRMPEELKVEINRKARSKGLTLTSYIRMVLIDHIAKDKRAI